MILLDGKKLSQKILEGIRKKVAAMSKKPRLAVVVVGQDQVIKKFIEQKKKIAQSVGIEVRVYPFDGSITTNELRVRIAEIVHEEKNHGVIVQLPLPPHINAQYILNAVVPEKDVDMLSSRAIGSFVVGKSSTMSPVAGAIKLLLEEYGILYRTKRIVIVGMGKLVGRPVALWLLGEHVPFSLVTKEIPGTEKIIKEADIIITGTGQPGFLTGSMIQEGAVVIDAGTSESEGKFLGDADFETISKVAGFFAPVPGGIGPLTIAVLFQNLLVLMGYGEGKKTAR